MSNFLICLLFILLLAAVLLLLGVLGYCHDLSGQIDRSCRRVAEVERREEQLRGFVVLNAVPRRMVMVNSMQDARELLERRLNPETLEWEPFVPHFGVDRGKLAPPAKGATGATP